MKITVEFLGLPTLSGVIGKKSEIDFPGGTVSDLTSFLIQRYGPKIRQMLLDTDGKLDSSIQVMINEDGFLPRHQLSETSIQENDLIRFLLLAGGG